VLRLLARGRTARQIAGDLAPDRHHHIEHIYGKVGVSSRAGAALFAVEHGLLDP
jgi:DNA-binding NarL/FixJ family response regulator